MKTIVCVKQVIDPEEPPSSFDVDQDALKISVPPGVPNVVSPFDKQATEAALLLKDQHGGSVSVLSLGSDLKATVLRDPIAMGADELVIVDDQVFSESDAWKTAYGLAKATEKIGDYDIIFTGRQDSEDDAGQVGTLMAQILGIPCVTLAKKIDVADGRATIERVTDDGFEVVSVDLPAVVTVSNELGEPRYPTVKQTMKARKVKPVIWSGGDLLVNGDAGYESMQKVKLVDLYKPKKDINCEMISGASPEEAGANLAVKLMEANLI